MAQTVPAKPTGHQRTDREIREQADSLLRRMTPDEKIGQLSDIFLLGKPGESLQQKIRKGEIGSFLFATDPALINRVQRIAVEESRLHIPLLFGFDVVHGFRTIFPVPIGMAATWDPDTVERAQAVAAAEARSVGIDWTFAPMVDIARDPRWGRIVEGAGEDPYLGAAMAAAQVRGFQGKQLGDADHLVACAKHFAGYGATEGGRDYDGAEISDSELWNVYLPPFKSAVDAGAGTLMSAYMDLNGVPASGNRWLLHDVLRGTWRFSGFVVSDSDAVKNLTTHGYAVDESDAAVRAFSAGVNMEMAMGKSAYGESLPQAFRNGKITVVQLNEAVRPILETKIRLGLFENPYVDESKAQVVLHDPAHREEARQAAEKSAVLLRNESHLLPLGTSFQKIAVIGQLADSKSDTVGPWTFAKDSKEGVTILDGLKQVAPQGTSIEYVPGVQIDRLFPSIADGIMAKKMVPWTEEQAKQEFARAVDAARAADLAIMVLGENQNMDGEGASRSSLELPGGQEQLLEAVAETGKPMVLVLLTARPLDLRWASSHVPAILDAWYPGTEGGIAIADLLYGKAVPSGKLPFTWPRDAGQVPLFYAHNTTHDPKNQGKRYWNEESTALFPFGFGMSYTNFEFSNLKISRSAIKKRESLQVSVDVENSGKTAADDVVQLYIHQRTGTSSRPVRELKGFRRVHLTPGQKSTVKLTVDEADLTYWSSATKSWIEDASVFDLWVGDDSAASLHSSFTVLP
jgi:beta-glucosidase